MSHVYMSMYLLYLKLVLSIFYLLSVNSMLPCCHITRAYVSLSAVYMFKQRSVPISLLFPCNDLRCVSNF